MTTITQKRFDDLTACYPQNQIAIIGDFCLDRYFEIDPSIQETSIETGLPVYNVVRIRCQAGGAGTVVNNLIALGAKCYPIGACGQDGEGWELTHALMRVGCRMDCWRSQPIIRTFAYNKPLLMHPGKAPEELNRLDMKCWVPMPEMPPREALKDFEKFSKYIQFCILMEQVDQEDKGILTKFLLNGIAKVCKERSLPCIADSRLGLSDYPPIIFKMNRNELGKLTNAEIISLDVVREQMIKLSKKNQQPVFVTMSEEGMCAANPQGEFFHVPAILLPGEIDVVGAGDSVTANLAMAMTAGGTLEEAMQLAMAAAAVTVHKLGTTGTASVEEIGKVLFA